MDSQSIPALVPLGSQVSDNHQKGGRRSEEREVWSLKPKHLPPLPAEDLSELRPEGSWS